MGSDPYWPHQALGGRCTPQSGRRSRTAAGHHPHFAACRASQQTASCLLDRKREKGRKRVEGGWNRGEKRDMVQLMAPFCRAERNLWNSNPPFISSLLCCCGCCCCCYCCWSYCSVVCYPTLVWGRYILVSSELFKSATVMLDTDDAWSGVGFR